uniref:Uncharacterized protein n=2 Tax=unclassified Caudoviricetes TaxID=2788787 RepID=A0AAU8HYJ9_9CAUD
MSDALTNLLNGYRREAREIIFEPKSEIEMVIGEVLREEIPFKKGSERTKLGTENSVEEMVKKNYDGADVFDEELVNLLTGAYLVRLAQKIAKAIEDQKSE